MSKIVKAEQQLTERDAYIEELREYVDGERIKYDSFPGQSEMEIAHEEWTRELLDKTPPQSLADHDAKVREDNTEECSIVVRKLGKGTVQSEYQDGYESAINDAWAAIRNLKEKE